MSVTLKVSHPGLEPRYFEGIVPGTENYHY